MYDADDWRDEAPLVEHDLGLYTLTVAALESNARYAGAMGGDQGRAWQEAVFETFFVGNGGGNAFATGTSELMLGLGGRDQLSGSAAADTLVGGGA